MLVVEKSPDNLILASENLSGAHLNSYLIKVQKLSGHERKNKTLITSGVHQLLARTWNFKGANFK